MIVDQEKPDDGSLRVGDTVVNSYVDQNRDALDNTKTVFEEMFRSGEGSAPVIRRLGLVQISDEPALLGVIEKVKAANPRQLADYRSGKDKLFGYFVGQVMKETQGQANPKVLNELLQKALRE